MTLALDARTIGSDAEALDAARAYASSIAPGAIERDRERRLPVAELEELGRSGLLALRVPAAFGGPRVRISTLVDVLRIISAADSSIGQVPQNHEQLVDAVTRWGDDAQRELLLGSVVRGARFGNAMSERGGPTVFDLTTTLRRGVDGTLRLDGRKYYSTGALTAQWVPVLARDEDGAFVYAFVPRDADGLEVEQDWTAFGQRATVSGTTIATAVAVRPEWIVPTRGPAGEADTHAALAQVLHAAVDVGIARNALEETAAFAATRARPWFESGVERAVDDPHVQLGFGRLATRLHAAEALLERAGRLLDEAEDDPAPERVTAARLGVGEAKAFGGEVALEIAGGAIELLGSSAADAAHGLDRHWRNARTHTLHDPNRIKYLHVGRHLLTGEAPAPDNWII